MSYIISFYEILGFHRIQGNTQFKPAMVRYKSIFKVYKLILNHNLSVTLIFHMNESKKPKQT